VKVINLPGSKDKYGEVLAATFKERLTPLGSDLQVAPSRLSDGEVCNNRRLLTSDVELHLNGFWLNFGARIVQRYAARAAGVREAV
jgi:hypothetical protein